MGGVKCGNDAKNGARYWECHLSAKTIIKCGTIDVPLDPEKQGEYRANRDSVEVHVAYEQRMEDALQRRIFSNIVAKFSTDLFVQRNVEKTATAGSLASGACARRQAQAATATSRKPFKWTARVG